VIQFLICVVSGLAIILISFRGRARTFGFITGLAGQPLWFYETVTRRQWGMFILSLWFTISYLNGLRNQFK